MATRSISEHRVGHLNPLSGERSSGNMLGVWPSPYNGRLWGIEIWYLELVDGKRSCFG